MRCSAFSGLVVLCGLVLGLDRRAVLWLRGCVGVAVVTRAKWFISRFQTARIMFCNLPVIGNDGIVT